MTLIVLLLALSPLLWRDSAEAACVESSQTIRTLCQYNNSSPDGEFTVVQSDFSDIRGALASCSSHLDRFMCAAFFPECSSIGQTSATQRPCRSLCEAVVSDCSASSTDLQARSEFNCGSYPTTNCVSIPPTPQCEPQDTIQSACGYNSTIRNSTLYPDPPAPADIALDVWYQHRGFEKECSNKSMFAMFGCAAFFPRCGDPRGPCRSLCEAVVNSCKAPAISGRSEYMCSRYPTTDCVAAPTVITPSSSTSIPTPSSTPPSNASLNGTGCPAEERTYFTDDAKRFAIGWILTWSLICFVSTMITMLTFCINVKRFQYPWRPVVYLALCFNIHSVAYFLGLAFGRQLVACPSNRFVHSGTPLGWQHVPCLLVFGLLYYTMMSAFLWWLVLTVGWFLAAALKWSSEAIGNLAPLFHIVSWVVPLVMTISLIAGQVVLADELTGMCFIVRDENSQSFFALLIGIIIPLILFLIVGVVFLLIGLFSVCRVRKFLHQKGQSKDSVVLEKLMIRIGIFVTLYILPAAVVIGCFLYELQSRPNWATVSASTSTSASCSDCEVANTTVFMLRIFMFLAIGILTGAWIWSRKTLLTWKEFCARCCCRASHEEVEVNHPPAAMEYSVEQPPDGLYQININDNYPMGVPDQSYYQPNQFYPAVNKRGSLTSMAS